MNAKFAEWTYLGSAQKIKKKKISRYFLKKIPVVVIFHNGQLYAYEDYCPHRGYPLSEGHICQVTKAKQGENRIVCPYHGWEFDLQKGNLLRRPGYVEVAPPAAQLQSFRVKVSSGLIFIRDHNTTESIPKWLKNLDEKNLPFFVFDESIESAAAHILENVLDPFHTHYVHRPFLRSDKQRAPVDVIARYTSEKKYLDVEYLNEPTPVGLISRIFESDRLKTVGQYYHPGVAVLEYWSKKGLDLRVTMVLTEQSPGKFKGGVVFQASLGPLAFMLKKPFFKKMATILLKQDFHFLKKQQMNLENFSIPPYLISNEEVVFKTITQLYANKDVTNFERKYKILI